jgi:hypothetical protein
MEKKVSRTGKSIKFKYFRKLYRFKIEQKKAFSSSCTNFTGVYNQRILKFLLK